MANQATLTMTLARNHVEAQLASFGGRLKELRLTRKWSLQELADRSLLSKTFLSRLERGSRQASIAAVLTLARVFGVSLASMFEEQLAEEPCLIVRRKEIVARTANGLTYIPLSNAERFFNIQPLLVTVPTTRRGKIHFQHPGEEWIYVISGRLTLSLAGRTYELEPGDAAHFDSQQPHRLIARGPHDAEVLVVASPFPEAGRAPSPLMRSRRAIPAPVSFAALGEGKTL